MNFNGVDLTDYLRINQIKGRGMVGRDIEVRDYSRSDGARILTKRRPPRTLEIEATIISEGTEALRSDIEEINGILAVSEPVPIIFPDEPLRTYYGIPELSEESTEFTYFHKGSLSILCPDPDRFGMERNLDVGTTGANQTIRGQKDVTWTSRTVFTVPQSTFTLTGSRGLSLMLNFDFIAGDVLVMEYATRKVTLNGNDLSKAVSMRSVWDTLKLGTNRMQASHATTVTYKERYY